MVLILVVNLMFHRCACVATVDCVLRWPIFRFFSLPAHIIKASSALMEEKLVGELFPNTVEYFSGLISWGGGIGGGGSC